MVEYLKKIVSETLKSWESGFIAFHLQRITGLLVLVYLFLHIGVLRAIVGGEAVYQQRIGLITSPVFKFFEWLLLFTVLFHTLNGVRILLVDFFGMVRLQKPLFWIVAALTALVLVVSIPEFFTFLY